MPENKDVDAWLALSDHPLLHAIRDLRDVILAADERMDECIKWQSPTFTYKGNFASVNPRAKKYVSLMVHRGAALPGHHPRLEGGGDTMRYMRFADAADVQAASQDIETVVRAWCAWRDEEDKGAR